ncbi:hypothetical protein FGU65_04445 [Methanoculleus sp. FWC-SCC1]|uniref:Virion structural protein n=1 Tax=Methanoculleus frigidifontis TaxID=2584085 RepID=A0ABT8M891_9EURY|nr:hypothetical protein [Methanoculleus sp. FWC-SCC1]MDN7024145.1 hypothetical protein [Methanoculleus sp. FWC-SCC1]
MSLYQLYVVPAEGREDEIAQMNAVKDIFTDYKITLDSLWMNEESETRGVTTSTSFQLGTLGSSTVSGGVTMPVLRPIGSTAIVEVNNPDRSEVFRIYEGSVSDGDITEGNIIAEIDPGALEYESQNNYWIQQVYYYQMGGVFLAQDSGTTTRISPLISIYPTRDDVTCVVIRAIQITGGGAVGGSTPVRVDTRFRDSTVTYEPESYSEVTLLLETPDEKTGNTWRKIFTESAKREGLDADWYDIDYFGGDASRPYITIYGKSGASDESETDVTLDLKHYYFAVTVQNVASQID